MANELDLLDQRAAAIAAGQPDPGDLTAPSPSGSSGGPSSGAAAPSGSVAGGATPSPGKPKANEGVIGRIGDAAYDMATFGFGDEIDAGLATLGISDGSYNTQSIWSSDGTLADTVAKNLATIRSQDKANAEAHPVATVAGDIAGGLLVPFGAGARTVGEFAKVGAAQGAIYGFGSGDSLGDRVGGAARDAASGAVLGAGVGKLFQVGGKAVKALLGRGGDAASEGAAAADAATEQVPPGKVLAWGTDSEGKQFPILSPGSLADRPKGVEVDITPAGTPDEVTTPKEAPPAKDPLSPADQTDQRTGPMSALDLHNFQTEAEGWSQRIAEGESPNLEADAPQGQWSLPNLGSASDTAGALATLARRVPAKGVVTDEDLMRGVKAAADETGLDPEAMSALSQAMTGSLSQAAHFVALQRTMWARNAQEVTNLHLANIDWSTASDEMVATAGEAIRNLSIQSQMVQEAKTGVGRALRVLQLPDADTYLGQLLGKEAAEASKAEVAAGEAGGSAIAPGESSPAGETVNPAPGGAADPGRPPVLPTDRQGIKEWLEAFHSLDGDPEAQANFIGNRLSIPTPSKYLRTSVANLFTADILSAPRTVFLNLIGPGFINMLRNGEKMWGGATLGVNPFVSAEERAGGRLTARYAIQAQMQTLGDISDVFRYAMKAAEQNRTVIGGGGVITDAGATFGPITPRLMDAANQSPSWQYSLGNLINVFPKYFSRINAGLDEAAKRLGANGELRLRAMVEAAQKGLTGDDAQQFVRKALQDGYDETGHLKSEEILRAAESNTLTSVPGEDGSWGNRFAKGMIAFRKDIPEARYILPVFNVSANGLGATLQRIPGLNALRGSLAFGRDMAELKGEHGPVLQAEAYGRWMTGAGFLLGGMILNRNGLLTGAGPQNPTDRKVWLQTHQPYSIRVGDEWVRYDKFDIMGGLLSIPATISDATTNRPADETTGELVSAGIGALAQWFKDRAALRNATSLLSTGDNPTAKASSVGQQLAGSVAQGLIPGSGLLGAVENVSDPYQRMRQSWSDYLRERIPTMSATLEPVRNVLGEPMNRSSDTFAEQLFPVTMAPVVTYKEDPVLDELDRLYQHTGYGAGADPKALGYGYFDPRQVKLEDGVSMYTHFMQARQTMEIGGKTLKESLGELFDSDGYNNAVDADPMQAKTSLGDTSRGYLVKKVFDQYNARIKAELASSSPKADAYLTAAAAKQRDDAYLGGTTVDDLVNDPGQYAAHGINPQAYSDKVRHGATGDLLQALAQ